MRSRHIIIFKSSVACDQLSDWSHGMYCITNLSNTDVPQKIVWFQDQIINLPIVVKLENKQLVHNALGKHNVHTLFGTPFRKENRHRTHCMYSHWETELHQIYVNCITGEIASVFQGSESVLPKLSTLLSEDVPQVFYYVVFMLAP